MERIAKVLVVAFSAALAGCGSANMPVWGEITFDGKPLDSGTIEFIPVDGTPGPSTGGTITDGQYDVPQPVGPRPGGTYQVAITAIGPTGRMVPHPLDRTKKIPEMTNIIPADYNRQTSLRITVAPRAADNQHDFHLEKQGRGRNP